MRKVKVLIVSFVIFLGMSTDFAGFVQGGLSVDNMKNATDYVTIQTFAKNVGGIANVIKEVAFKGSDNKNTANEYADTIADQTTKSVEKVITEQQKKKAKKMSMQVQ